MELGPSMRLLSVLLMPLLLIMHCRGNDLVAGKALDAAGPLAEDTRGKRHGAGMGSPRQASREDRRR